ncbi:hypothetical protein FQA39_LY01173 [Lamprigera yunnana]|nr:hypothetical protein FQA39_LY01173 [Lamprigera yunnana]
MRNLAQMRWERIKSDKCDGASNTDTENVVDVEHPISDCLVNCVSDNELDGNETVVNGMISMGSSYSQLSELMASLKVLCMTADTYSKIENKNFDCLQMSALANCITKRGLATPLDRVVGVHVILS